jgi:hypothetical protein
MATLTRAERVDLLRRLMWKCINDYETEFRTHIARTRKMMQDHGAEATMEKLMAKPGSTSAFARCNDAQRLDLSFEYTLEELAKLLSRVIFLTARVSFGGGFALFRW